MNRRFGNTVSDALSNGNYSVSQKMAKKLWQYVKPFLSNTGTSRTDEQKDGQTDRIAILSCISTLMCDKNYLKIGGCVLEL